VCGCTVFLSIFCEGANFEQCTPGIHERVLCANDVHEETSLLQVHAHTSSRSEPEESNPLKKAASELVDKCTVPDDQAACDKAISLAGLLEKLTQGKSQDQIAEAAKVSSLASWFRNPAGPGGFFNFVDEDDSGSLSGTELLTHDAMALMQLIDSNNDGQASREECRGFLRGCAVLFKKLPTADAGLAQMSVHFMLKDADTVRLQSTAATGPGSNPLTKAASELRQSCPELAEEGFCDTAVALANFLAKLTAETPPENVVEKASHTLELWYWFQHPEGPVGLFNAADRFKQGFHTAADLLAVAGRIPGAQTNPNVDALVKFADTDKDERISRAECRSYLGACALLMEKLPMLDLLTATKPLSERFMLADSVMKM